MCPNSSPGLSASGSPTALAHSPACPLSRSPCGTHSLIAQTWAMEGHVRGREIREERGTEEVERNEVGPPSGAASLHCRFLCSLCSLTRHPVVVGRTGKGERDTSDASNIRVGVGTTSIPRVAGAERTVSPLRDCVRRCGGYIRRERGYARTRVERVCRRLPHPDSAARFCSRGRWWLELARFAPVGEPLR